MNILIEYSNKTFNCFKLIWCDVSYYPRLQDFSYWKLWLCVRWWWFAHSAQAGEKKANRRKTQQWKRQVKCGSVPSALAAVCRVFKPHRRWWWWWWWWCGRRRTFADTSTAAVTWQQAHTAAAAARAHRRRLKKACKRPAPTALQVERKRASERRREWERQQEPLSARYGTNGSQAAHVGAKKRERDRHRATVWVGNQLEKGRLNCFFASSSLFRARLIPMHVVFLQFPGDFFFARLKQFFPPLPNRAL